MTEILADFMRFTCHVMACLSITALVMVVVL